MKSPKAVKEIRATLSQMDEALRLSELGAKQRADLLAEKSKLLVTLLSYERETIEHELKTVRAENERLRQELTAKPATRPLSEVEIVLQNYEKEKGRTA